jgi:hypothetical protein
MIVDAAAAVATATVGREEDSHDETSETDREVFE